MIKTIFTALMVAFTLQDHAQTNREYIAIDKIMLNGKIGFPNKWSAISLILGISRTGKKAFECKLVKKIMKNIIVTIGIFLLGCNMAYCQDKSEVSHHKMELHKVLDKFMHSLKTKDSTSMYNLFYDGPVTWVGVYKDKTQQKRMEKDAAALNYKIADYKTWFSSTTKGSVKEEKFSNVNIDTDGSIASITFDFSFWAGGKKGLWGKESWGLVNIKNEWKITSVIFSMENENVSPERR